jgi:zinc transport system ATP-binding protein
LLYDLIENHDSKKLGRLLMTEANDYFLQISDLNVQFQKDIILEHVHFKIKKGTTLAIVGPNGAGKTMLFKAILNLIPYTGKIEWGEEARIGYVPQNVSVKDIPISVEEFLSYKKRRKH